MCDNKDCHELECLKQDVREHVKEELKGLPMVDIQEYDLHELVDGWVPIMTHDLLQYALSDLWLAVEEPEVYAFDGKHTAVSAIARNIYQELMEAAEEARTELIETEAPDDGEKQ